jgi:hypothetical protein
MQSIKSLALITLKPRCYIATILGQIPPQDIWPSNVERFSKTEFRRVDLNKNWLFPRNLMSPGACFLLAVVLFSPLLIQASSSHGWGIITLFAVLFVIVFIWRSFKKSDNESGCSTGGCSGDSDSSDSGDSGCACGGCGGE